MTVELIEMTEPTVVEVWAPSCHECRAMQPDIHATAADFSGKVDFVAVNAADDPTWAQRAGVMATPTLIGVANGEEAFRVIGRRSKDELGLLFAAIESGERVAAVGRQDRILRTGTGTVLLVVGLALGPAWPLVAAGVAITGWGVGFPKWSARD